MIIKGLVDEDFINYKRPNMFIIMPYCSLKCDKENGNTICQNSNLITQPTHDIQIPSIIKRYLQNDITQAIVFGGLEPFDSFDDLYSFIEYCRIEVASGYEVNKDNSIEIRHLDDDIVIYTGYNKEEIEDKVNKLKQFKNIIIKFGRYIPNQKPHYDPVLGVYLASDNQYAERLDYEVCEKDVM